ncbi:MAG TPA: TerC family protein [Myxococcota bacterium]|nr:TerC family protein [Myxococcota bacterium]
METVGTPALWLGFVAFVLLLLALDLGVFHRKAHEVSAKEAGIWSAVWVTLALAFNALVVHWFGAERGLEFLTGYLIEKALAVDNIFVFYAIFAWFAVPAAYQHRVLFWGVLGALVMRAIFIALGAALITKFHWVLYIFGAILVFTGIKLFAMPEDGIHPERNPVYRLMRRLIPTVPEYHGARFTVVQQGRRYATPLLIVLLLIEWTDVVFAVDSIPAIFAVTTDPFIVFTSNIFAILGLRSLFFLLQGVIGKFHLLKPALAAVLLFVGAKMLLLDFVKVPIGISLAVIAALIGAGIVASLLVPPRAATTPRDR